MYILYIVTIAVIILSFLIDKNKTKKALFIAAGKLLRIVPDLLLIVFIVSFSLYFIPQDLISQYIQKGNGFSALFLSMSIGSLTLMPGFIAFPLAGMLKEKEVPHYIISGFTTTLMMVGIITFPLERKYFGVKVTCIRNGISVLIAFFVAVVTGVVYGELF